MIQRGIVLGAGVGLVAIALVAAAEVSARSQDACANPAATAELRAATRSLDDAVHAVQAAMSGGSLYAAAKVAAADPAEVERATARQREVFMRLQAARAACGLQVAA